jgi:hypothetical protein
LQVHATTRFTPCPDVAASIHDHGVVFFHLKHGCLFTSNRTGAHIWRGLQQQLAAEHIAEQISRHYDIAPATAHEHTTRFISQLEERRLIERRRV